MDRCSQSWASVIEDQGTSTGPIMSSRSSSSSGPDAKPGMSIKMRRTVAVGAIGALLLCFLGTLWLASLSRSTEVVAKWNMHHRNCQLRFSHGEITLRWEPIGSGTPMAAQLRSRASQEWDYGDFYWLSTTNPWTTFGVAGPPRVIACQLWSIAVTSLGGLCFFAGCIWWRARRDRQPRGFEICIDQELEPSHH